MDTAALKCKYCLVPKDDFDNFLSYLRACLRQAEDVKSHIFKTHPSLDEMSLEENEYEFLRIPNLDMLGAEDLFSEIWKIFEKYSSLFERMGKQHQNEDVSYYNQLEYTLRNCRVLQEHVLTWLGKTPQPVDDVPSDIWSFSKSDAVVRDITIIKTYVKTLTLILDSLNKLKWVQMFNREEFMSSNSV